MSTNEYQKMKERVRHLLNKAEATEFPHEAETFVAKAQELMTRYAIAEAELESSRQDTARPIHIKIETNAPYTLQKATLIGSIAKANRCRVVVDHKHARGSRNIHVFGFDHDVTNVEMLYHSLLLQCVAAMMRAQEPARVGLKTFRVNFMSGFAGAIYDRLRTSTRNVEKDMSGGAAIVLRDRSLRVDDAVKQEFPRLTKGYTTTSSRHGMSDGRTAGMKATMSKGSLPSRKQIGS